MQHIHHVQLAKELENKEADLKRQKFKNMTKDELIAELKWMKPEWLRKSLDLHREKVKRRQKEDLKDLDDKWKKDMEGPQLQTKN